jgi:glycerophosphoryl diester phosphodiesterase
MSMTTGANRPFFQSGKNSPEVIAHRGGGGEWPGETLYAFEKAIELGVDILEMDVHRTIDGALVLMHNDSVDETTDGRGRIRDLTLAEIKRLNAGFHWPPEIRELNIRVPTLQEAFEAFPHQRMNIEIKQREPSIVTQFGELIQQHGMTDRVLVASFWDGVLDEFRAEFPEVATSASTPEAIKFYALDDILFAKYRPDTDAIQADSKASFIHLITRHFVEKAHKLNLKVHAWTVNEPKEMQRMIEVGVDGIITDFPTRLLKILGRI